MESTGAVDTQDATEEQSQQERLNEAAGRALEGMGKALAALLLVAVIIIARALQAVFILARFAVYPACAAVEVYGAIVLFRVVSVRYGGDFAAILLALALTILVPASMLILKGDLPVWPVLLGAGLLSLGAAWLVERAHPLVLALVPVVALSACILSFAFQNGGKDGQA